MATNNIFRPLSGATSIFTKKVDQVVRVTDCPSNCSPADQFLDTFAARLHSHSAPMGLVTDKFIDSIDLQSILALNGPANLIRNTTPTVIAPFSILIENGQYFRRVNERGYDDYAFLTTTTSATTWTSFQSDLNRDLALIANSRTRPFGFMYSFEVPVGLSKVEFRDTNGVGVLEWRISDDDCQKLNIFLPFRGTTRALSDLTNPTSPAAFRFTVPRGFADVLAPATGTPIGAEIRAFDINNLQVATAFNTERWTLWYTDELNSLFLNMMTTSSLPLQTLLTPRTMSADTQVIVSTF